MKVCVIQPEYSLDYSQSDEFFQRELDALDRCDESMDLIAMPEYSNIPCWAQTKEQMRRSYEKYTEPLLQKASETAKRCNALVFLSCLHETETGLRNGTIIFGRDGNREGVYHKQHLVNSEMYTYELDKDYTWEHSEPTIAEVEGVRYAFLICYDAYFYEAFANIARYDPDVVIACSYQRSDSHDALRTMHKFLAYNTNAYVIRSSVSMGLHAGVGGTSMVIAPVGTVLADMEGKVGMATAEIDPHKHYLKPAGFGNPPDCHHHYVEAGRRPWKYRNSGSAMVLYDDLMPYPRVCAHRGFNSIAPENSMPAFGAAIAMGAEEIEFDLWPTKDGTIVSIHDSSLERVSNGTGKVWEYTYEELLQFDFGCKHGPEFAGLKIPSFEEILKKCAGHTVMNIHVKDHPNCPITEEEILQIARLVKKYDCERYCYFMSGNGEALDIMRRVAPKITRCAGADDWHNDLLQKALDYGCKKIQLFQPHFQYLAPDYVETMCRKAHENGILVNYFWTDNAADVADLLNKGVDTILSNDYNRIAQAVAAWKK